MSPEELEYFFSKFGQPMFQNTAASEYIEKYRDKLPDALLNFWLRYGFCGFKEGLFWIVNAGAYKGVLDAWVGDTDIVKQDIFYVIARNAFGDLYLWGEKTGHKYKIIPRMGWILQQEDDAEDIANGEGDDALGTFLAYKSPEDLDMKDNDKTPLFDRAIKKLGPLAADEMFAFEPALIMNNRAKLENITKANVFEHLSYLAQLGQRSIMSAATLANALR